MKKLLLASFILLFIACKENKVDIPDKNMEPIGFNKFAISGIPDENIRIKNNIIVIQLPAGFTQTLLKPTIVLTHDFKLPASIGNGFDFQGKEIWFSLESKTYAAREYRMVVIPHEAPTFPEDAAGYNLTIEKDTKVTLPVIVQGTSVTVDSSGNLQQEPKVTFINRVDNKSAGEFPARFAKDAAGKMVVELALPPGLVAGEYTAILKWGIKKASAPRALQLKFGKLYIEPVRRSATAGTEFYNIAGYNIAPENKYELLLENDFIKSRRIPLNRKDYNNLEMPIPTDLPTGSYKSTMLVNSVAMPREPFPFFSAADFHYKEYADQNVLAIVTQPSHKVQVQPPLNDYYKETATISKNEDLMIFTLKFNNQAAQVKLRLRNVDTGEKFTLTHTGTLTHIFDAALSFYRFNITKIPAGKYEAYSIVGEEAPTMTEKYYQILHIQ